ncbi:hypothetical protein NQ318_021576 [Aromia moschata]|uniref:Uncharacterized protein n=1 Tax=Aromia moschata TaxID=1265417 RepID=A0AAV8YKQ7_9CUCU|nr:hypothetical protein NQ318_021576 [Aromia moschata]
MESDSDDDEVLSKLSDEYDEEGSYMIDLESGLVDIEDLKKNTSDTLGFEPLINQKSSENERVTVYSPSSGDYSGAVVDTAGGKVRLLCT